jgi:sugar phosphate isomerase/epimerase
MNRRTFVKTVAVAGAVCPLSLAIAGEANPKSWPIGCFNRPWVNDKKGWTYDTALDGIKAAGFKITGLLTPMAGETFLAANNSREHMEDLKRKISERGLKAIMGALRTKPALPMDQQIADMRKQIDHGQILGVEYLLTFGVDQPSQYENYYKLMQDAAPYAQERKMKLVLKPHGGASGAAEEIVRCLDKVKQPNFKIWFDAGNIVFYTGKDPVEQLKPIADKVTGFCAKDCARQGGEIWLNFGQGKVDFPAVFKVLKDAGFNGPVMIECCAHGETPEATADNARINREYLEKLFASL